MSTEQAMIMPWENNEYVKRKRCVRLLLIKTQI